MRLKENRKPQTIFEWMGFRNNPDWTKALPLGSFVGFILTLTVPLLFIGAIGAAFAVIWHTVIHGFGSGDAGPSLGAGALIAALLGAPFLIWGTFLKHRTVEFQKEGHITERISKAVEQLGAEKTVKRQLVNSAGKKLFRKAKDGKVDFSQPVFDELTVPNIEVRIGGLLSLERIAQDSTRYDKGRDHVRVMEILCAYVRENAPASEAKDFPLPEWEPLADDASDKKEAEHRKWREVRFQERYDSNASEWARSLADPRVDIALALRVIGRRDENQRQVEACWGQEAIPDAHWVFDLPCPELPELPHGQSHESAVVFHYQKRLLQDWHAKTISYRGYRLNLRKTNLQKSDLSELVLSGADLTGSRLEGANLTLTRLERANLQSTRMDGADFSGAQLQGGNFSKAQAEGAFFYETEMQGSSWAWSRLMGAFFGEVNLQGASLVQARIEGVEFVGARLEGSDFRGAWMAGAEFDGAQMDGIRFDIAKMNFIGSLADTDLSVAALKNVSLVHTSISEDQLKVSFGDSSVSLPEPLTSPKHWPIWELPEFGNDAFEIEWHKWQADPQNYTPPPPPDDHAANARH